MPNRVYFNFEDDDRIEGGINFRAVYEGGFDITKPLHRFCLNLFQMMEREAVSKTHESVNQEEPMPITEPTRTLYDA